MVVRLGFGAVCVNLWYIRCTELCNVISNKFYYRMQIIFDVEHPDETPVESGTIFCVGRNYVDHILELGNEKPSNPIVFVKPECALRHGSYNVIEYPPASKQLEFEGERRNQRSARSSVDRD